MRSFRMLGLESDFWSAADDYIKQHKMDKTEGLEFIFAAGLEAVRKDDMEFERKNEEKEQTEEVADGQS